MPQRFCSLCQISQLYDFTQNILETIFNQGCSRLIFMNICFCVYVLKQAKSHDLFYIWLTKLSAHRIYKKNESMGLHQGVLHALSSGSSTLPAIASLAQRNRAMSCMMVSAKPGSWLHLKPEGHQAPQLTGRARSIGVISSVRKMVMGSDLYSTSIGSCLRFKKPPNC